MSLAPKVLLNRWNQPEVAARVALAATLGAFLLRLAAALWMGDHYHWPDEMGYVAHAARVAHGTWWGPTSFVPPGHYYLLSLVFLFTGKSVLAGRLFEAALSAASVWLLFRLVRRASPGAAALAAWTLALYPLVVYSSVTLYPQTPAQLMLLGALNALMDHAQRPGPGRLLSAGLLLAATALTVPTVLMICPVLGVWLWWVCGRDLRAVLHVAGLAACVVLGMAPWIARNFVVERHFIPVATVGSQIFFFANNENADPNLKDLSLVDRVYTPEIKEAIRVSGNADSVYSARASRFIQEHPGRFVRNYLVRLAHFFDLYPTTFTHDGDNGLLARLVTGFTSGPVLLLALFGAWTVVRGSPGTMLWLLVPLSWGFASAVFGVSIRYRIPVEPCIIALAACAAWRWAGLWTKPPLSGPRAAA